MTMESWLLFLPIALAATLSPGPAVLVVTTNALQYGPSLSVLTILGNISGLFFMSLCSVIGLSTIILYSSLGFAVVKTAGALYLIYLGVKYWQTGITIPLDSQEVKKQRDISGVQLYTQGFLVALTNPKAIAFTSALFPQFINPAEPLASQFLILVCSLMVCSFGCLFCYAHLSVSTGRRALLLVNGKTWGKALGSLFIASGLALAALNND